MAGSRYLKRPSLKALENRFGEENPVSGRLRELGLSNYYLEKPSFKKLGLQINADGSIIVSQHQYVSAGESNRGRTSYGSLREAVRGTIHAIESERERAQKVRSLYEEVSDLHSQLPSLGRDPKKKDLDRVVERLESMASRMELKKRPKIRRSLEKLLGPKLTGEKTDSYEDKRGEERIPARSLLSKNNWPAVQAQLVAVKNALKKEHEDIFTRIMPVLRAREEVLRGYHSLHLNSLGPAYHELLEAEELLENKEINYDELKQRLVDARELVTGLKYAGSHSVKVPLNAALKHAGNSNHVQVRRALNAARQKMGLVLEKLSVTSSAGRR